MDTSARKRVFEFARERLLAKPGMPILFLGLLVAPEYASAHGSEILLVLLVPLISFIPFLIAGLVMVFATKTIKSKGREFFKFAMKFVALGLINISSCIFVYSNYAKSTDARIVFGCFVTIQIFLFLMTMPKSKGNQSAW